MISNTLRFIMKNMLFVFLLFFTANSANCSENSVWSNGSSLSIQAGYCGGLENKVDPELQIDQPFSKYRSNESSMFSFGIGINHSNFNKENYYFGLDLDVQISTTDYHDVSIPDIQAVNSENDTVSIAPLLHSELRGGGFLLSPYFGYKICDILQLDDGSRTLSLGLSFSPYASISFASRTIETYSLDVLNLYTFPGGSDAKNELGKHKTEKTRRLQNKRSVCFGLKLSLELMYIFVRKSDYERSKDGHNIWSLNLDFLKAQSPLSGKWDYLYCGVSLKYNLIHKSLF